LKDFKLTALLDITKAINNNFSTAELLTIYESIVRDKLQIRRLVLYSHDSDGWKRLLFFGKEDAFSGVDVTTHLLPLREITTLDITGNSGNNLQEIVIPVFHKSSPLAYVLIGDLDEAERGMSSAVKHLPFIQTLTNIMMVAIENKRLAKEKTINTSKWMRCIYHISKWVAITTILFRLTRTNWLFVLRTFQAREFRLLC